MKECKNAFKFNVSLDYLTWVFMVELVIGCPMICWHDESQISKNYMQKADKFINKANLHHHYTIQLTV